MRHHIDRGVEIVPGNPIASRLQLPPGPWVTVLDGLCARFPAITRERWIDRFARERVLDDNGKALSIDAPYRIGMEVRYFREVVEEPEIPFAETVLYADDDLVVADKPHFLPVTPSGGHVRETLLSRLQRRLDNVDLVPVHRIDRDTAGLVLFSAKRQTRTAYQDLFRLRRIEKRYEALAPALQHAFPCVNRSRIVPGKPFFRMQEVTGDANSETRIDVIERRQAYWRYALTPASGRKHQLRVQMSALGAPILGDTLYPELRERASGDYSQPLQLLAKSLVFVDPLSGEPRRFDSRFSLPTAGFNHAGAAVS